MITLQQVRKVQYGETLTQADVDEINKLAPSIQLSTAACHEMLYGLGPYEVTDVKLSQYPKNAGHTQQLTVNGDKYSGMFFKPMER